MGDGTWSDDIPNRLEAVENVYTDSDVTIASTDWTLSSGSYVYTWTSALVTANCGIEVFLRDGAESAGIEDFDASKVSGGVQFTTDEQPTGSLPVTIRIINTKSDQLVSLSADEVSSEAISGCDDVETALGNLDGRVTTLNSNTAKINTVASIEALQTLISSNGATAQKKIYYTEDAFAIVGPYSSANGGRCSILYVTYWTSVKYYKLMNGEWTSASII